MPRLTPTSLLLMVLLLLSLLGGCAPLPAGSNRRTGGEEPATPIAVATVVPRATYTVTTGTVTQEMSFQGRVAPILEQPLSFLISAPVKTIYAERGDQVEAGEVLAELDTQALQEQHLLLETALDIAQTRLTSQQTELDTTRRRAEIGVELAQLDLTFAQQTAGENPSTAQQYQINRLTLELELAQLALQELPAGLDPTLQAEVDSIQLQLTELDQLLAQNQLVAPFTGELLFLNLTPGQTVNVGEVVGAVGDISQKQVRADLVASRVSALTEGLPAQLSLIDRPGETWPGSLQSLPYQPDDSGQVSLFFAFDDSTPTAELSIGERVTILIVIEEHTDVLWLPLEAIRDFNGRKFVVIQDGQIQRRLDVTLGLIGRDRVEILTGLQAGDVVISP